MDQLPFKFTSYIKRRRYRSYTYKKWRNNCLNRHFLVQFIFFQFYFITSSCRDNPEQNRLKQILCGGKLEKEDQTESMNSK